MQKGDDIDDDDNNNNNNNNNGNNIPMESPAGRKRRLFGATVLNLPLPSTFLVTKTKSPTYPIHQPARKCKMHYTHDNGERS